MDAVSYYSQWAARAFPGALASTRTFWGAIGIFAGFGPWILESDWFQRLVPQAEYWMAKGPEWLIWAPFFVFIAFLIYRTVAAPYWIHADLRRDNNRLKEQLTQKIGKQEIKNVLGGFIHELNQLISDANVHDKTEGALLTTASQLQGRIEAYLGENLGTYHVAQFNSLETVHDSGRTKHQFPSKVHWRIHSQSFKRAARLQQFISELA